MIEELKYYGIQAISNSSLKDINPEQGGSPALFKKNVIDRDGENIPKASFENGKLVHKYVEDPTAFVVSDFSKPTETMASWVERVFYKLYVLYLPTVTSTNFYDQQELIGKVALDVREGAYGKMKEDTVVSKFLKEGLEYISYLFLEKGESIIMTPNQQEMMTNIINSINSCPMAHELLFKKPEFGSTEIQLNEEAIYWKRDVVLHDETLSMNMKSLIDRFTLKFNDEKTTAFVKLIDFKTTGKGVVKFEQSFKSYRYYRQLAFYRGAIMSYIDNKFPEFNGDVDFEYYIVAVETHSLYQCKVFKISLEWILKGYYEVENLLKTIAYHQHTGQWSRTKEEVDDGYVTLKLEEDVCQQ